MKILYIGKHDTGHNDDEGAITHALLQLGHDVQRVREERGDRAYRMSNCAFALCHHWHDFASLQAIRIPKVFWCFDLIQWPNDPRMVGRNRQRMAWARQMTSACNLGFMTDGDWVASEGRGRLHWLPQGADERVTGVGEASKCDRCGGPWCGVDILFVGGGKGYGRESFVSKMRERYGDSFLHVDHGSHGRDLANLVANAKIVVAPDTPVTHRYWSNRVYNMLGFGACLLHPYCEFLEQQYHKGGIVFYRSRDELHLSIERLLRDPVERREVAMRGHYHTIAAHLYRHRCEELVRIVREKLL